MSLGGEMTQHVQSIAERPEWMDDASARRLDNTLAQAPNCQPQLPLRKNRCARYPSIWLSLLPMAVRSSARYVEAALKLGYVEALKADAFPPLWRASVIGLPIWALADVGLLRVVRWWARCSPSQCERVRCRGLPMLRRSAIASRIPIMVIAQVESSLRVFPPHGGPTTTTQKAARITGWRGRVCGTRRKRAICRSQNRVIAAALAACTPTPSRF